MCRIHVKNPSKESLYMNNWYLKDECIRLFCNHEKKQVAILHIQVCEQKKPCPDAPPKFVYEVDLERFIFQKVSDYNGQYLSPEPILQLTMFCAPAQFIPNTK